MAAGPLGLVAVGTQYQGEDYDAVVFTSPDGLAWSRVPDPEGVFGGPGWQGMHAVTAGGPGWVAVGYDDSGEDWNAAVWTSPDGVTWTASPTMRRCSEERTTRRCSASPQPGRAWWP